MVPQFRKPHRGHATRRTPLVLRPPACGGAPPNAHGGRIHPPPDGGAAGHQPRDLYAAGEQQPKRDPQNAHATLSRAGLRPRRAVPWRRSTASWSATAIEQGVAGRRASQMVTAAAASRAGSEPAAERSLARAIQGATFDLEPGPGAAANIGGGLVLRDETLVSSPLHFLPRIEAVGGQAARRED